MNPAAKATLETLRGLAMLAGIGAVVFGLPALLGDTAGFIALGVVIVAVLWGLEYRRAKRRVRPPSM